MMAETDFFDDDLTSGPAEKKQQESEALTAEVDDQLESQTMGQKKEQVNAQVASAVEEIERLRRRQNDLERERTDLEDISRKQDEYEQGKRNMIERLAQGFVILQKQETETSRLLELLGLTNVKFKDLLSELKAINDEKWSDKNFREELDKALVLIDNARMEYNKAASRIDVLKDGKGATGELRPFTTHEAGGRGLIDVGFGYWVKVGIALSMPVVIIAIVVLAYLIIMQMV